MALHKKILIAAGGTGGHLFPAVAVAKKLIITDSIKGTDYSEGS